MVAEENMQSFNKCKIQVFIFFFISSLILGCQKSNEQIPFFDGMYLNYHEVFTQSQKPENVIWTRDIMYHFQSLENENYHISQKVNTQINKKLDKKIEPTPYPLAGDNLTIDKNGIVLKGGDNFMNFIEGFPSSLWLPFDKRKEGTEVIEVIRKVENKMRWEGWQVWPVKGMLGDKHYYDVNTGILVGIENLNGTLKMILVDTNFDALKATLSEKSR